MWTPTEDWDRSLRTNLSSVFLGSEHAVLAMREQGSGGSIVNTASVAAFTTTADTAAYVASKSGGMGLTVRSLSPMRRRGSGVMLCVPVTSSRRCSMPSWQARAIPLPRGRSSRRCTRRSESSSRAMSPTRRCFWPPIAGENLLIPDQVDRCEFGHHHRRRAVAGDDARWRYSLL
ncbi:SDR family NAD(P)-dependent oxidoreductase [Mycolicibacterium diernhoferi]|uniref:SDR family NAD(P)-dependent oxidoreductase n=1 Tax=Mycolicibacterium diernhoferi TaxID=1801 RepID=A0A2A7NXY1_9MYCO|nr:hypothetical protein CRI78_05585 [Mycolicibacterium diernhoferi]QYL25463.1 SDR family NAD(P)-dependent oxidoreductase [Mycolicibacterium diernhoferi]